jgi:type III pantothenate kinase
MKVAMVSEHASPLSTLGGVDAGGQNVHVAALASAVAAAGHDVVVHTRRDDASLPSVVDLAPRVRVHHLDAGPPEAVPKDDLFTYMPEFARALNRSWSRWTPDVVHSHFWMSGWAARRAARGIDLPVVHTYHALGVTKRRQQGVKDTSPEARIEVEASLARRCDHIIATSTEEIFELVRMGARPARVSLVPCGVDTTCFAPANSHASHHRPTVLVVSRLVERKGIGNVVEALTALPGVQLIVAGGPDARALDTDAEARRLGAIARTCGVEDRVRLLGRVARDELPGLYAAADVVACVPWYEPFGLVALEAMACGKPVVAAAVGGLVDTVIDGVTGLLVPPRDPGAIAHAMHRILGDRALASALGRAGARRARTRYTWAAVAGETVDAYRVARRAGSHARAAG